jgi:hypothetical protein
MAIPASKKPLSGALLAASALMSLRCKIERVSLIGIFYWVEWHS